MRPSQIQINVDGEAHLFNSGITPYRFLVVTTTGCVAVRAPGEPDRIFYWYFRSKGSEPIVLLPSRWLILWSCAAPWNTQRAGYITRLHCGGNNLNALNVRSLVRLAHLRCECNMLTRLDCSGLTRLRSVNVSENELTELDVTGCRSLSYLKMNGNPQLSQSPRAYLTQASGQPVIQRRRPLTQTSLFDL